TNRVINQEPCGQPVTLRSTSNLAVNHRPLRSTSNSCGQPARPYLNTNAHKCGPSTNSPITTASIALNKTAPAATSLAIFASVLYSGEARSTHNSITVLNISAMKTLVIASKIIANSTAKTSSPIPI